MRYRRLSLDIQGPFSTLIGQLGLVPLFGALDSGFSGWASPCLAFPYRFFLLACLLDVIALLTDRGPFSPPSFFSLPFGKLPCGHGGNWSCLLRVRAYEGRLIGGETGMVFNLTTIHIHTHTQTDRQTDASVGCTHTEYFPLCRLLSADSLHKQSNATRPFNRVLFWPSFISSLPFGLTTAYPSSRG